MIPMMRKYIFGIVIMAASVSALALAPYTAFAASLYFSPAAKTVSVGDNFTVSVDVSSADRAMNAASGDISFPSAKLRVLSVSNADSAMNLWVQNPSFSNAASGGDINFAGVVLNPGFTGAAGNVVIIRFQAVAAGSAELSFSTGSVLANDGNGTDILDSMGTADVTITPAVSAGSAASPAPTVSAPDTTPPAPFVISSVLDSESTTTDPTDPQPIFAWSTTDPLSGIAKYMVKIGDGDWFDASAITVPGASDEYQLPLQAPEQNVLLAVEAYDNAGNMTEATTTFSIAPLPTPIITSYTSNLASGHPILNVKGLMPRGSLGKITTVKIYLQQNSNLVVYAVPVDQNGDFNLNQTVSLPSGNWNLYAQASDGRGAIGPDTPEVAVVVGAWVTEVIAFLLSWGAILVAAILLLAAIIAVAYLLIYHGRRFHLSLARNLVRERKELRDDLKRIEKELEADRPNAKIDLSPAGMRKKQQLVHKEIEHIEEDLKRDIKENE
jgi:hypothetical protein